MPQVFAPLVAAIGITGTAATVVSSALALGATTAAQYVIGQATTQKPESGTKLQAVGGGTINQAILLGEKETAGSLIYRGSYGYENRTPNSHHVRVYACSDAPADGMMTHVWADGGKRALGETEEYEGYPVPYFDEDGANRLWIKALTGSQTTANGYLRAKFGEDASRPWMDDMIGRQRTIVIVTQRLYKKKPRGLIDCRFVFRGMPVYDWRQDSTNGGSGSQRWGSEATYVLRRNAIVLAYNIARGVMVAGEVIYGGPNFPARRFDRDSWTAAANVADEDLELASGGTIKRGAGGAEISLDEEPLTVIERLLASAGYRMVISGGVMKLASMAAGASVMSFTDDDVVVTQDATQRLFPAREDIANVITGAYTSPEDAGESKPYRERSRPAYVTEDGGERRARELNLPYVRHGVQAQKLASLALNDNRRFRSHVVYLPSIARKLEPGDAVTFTSDEYGYSAKKFLLGDVVLNDDGLVSAAIREADATDADFPTSDQQVDTAGVYGDIVAETQVAVFTASPAVVKNASGKARIPAIRLAWETEADDVDARSMRYWVRRLGDTDIIDSGRFDFEDGTGLISGRLIDALVYEVQCQIAPYSDRDTDRSDWVTVAAGSVKGRASRIASSGFALMARKSPALNWSGDTVGQTYVETISVTRAIRVSNDDANPVRLQLSGRLRLNCQDDGSNGDGASFLIAVLKVEARAPGASDWRDIRNGKSLRLESRAAGRANVKPKNGTIREVFSHLPGKKDGGDWRYRVTLIVRHKRGAGREWDRAAVLAGATLAASWERD
ncbi:hypothetical protein M2360_000934 [Rhizobium sp. SG_E_25_P2]|uniref:phage tail protein n=1 Tax=Rhizobium sp. SG_E_25_P2 TaxID=2879942 RepID=UPI0024770FBA|nr:phage tail protein [Rhizobium sp. SG_E_25_P2]MDH6265544.1 hypothetical protein [Rhizobium sp. SG_E_25_P2]